MALRNGQKIATKLKQLPHNYSESLFMGKTRNLSGKKSESLVKITSESSSRLHLSSTVPFFTFEKSLLQADGRGAMKLVRTEVKRSLTLSSRIGKSGKTPRVPRSSKRANQRLKMLMEIKSSTPRTIAKTVAKIQQKFSNIQRARDLNVSMSQTLDTFFFRSMDSSWRAF